MEQVQHREILGMPRSLFLGFVALLLFMIGDGVELAFLSRYMVDSGFSVGKAASVFSVYGLAVAISSWLSGVFSEIFGPKNVMKVGFAIWAIFHAAFLVFGIGQMNYPMMLVTYGIRGFGFPMFSFAFLVWIAYATPVSRLSSAYGWFWFCFAGGLGAAGAFVPSFSLPILGYMGTLWFSYVFIIPGGILGAFLLKERHGLRKATSSAADPNQAQPSQVTEFLRGISILWQNPRVAAGGVVRVINTTSQYGFVVCLPLYFTDVLGLSTTQWLQIWGGQNSLHILFIVMFGFVGNRFRWHKVIQWWGCVFTGVACLMIYYIAPYMGASVLALTGLMAFYACGLAAFVPLSAIMPSLEPERKGTSAGILNLGAGLSTVVGPGIVGIVYPTMGLKGVVWTFFVLYIIAAILCQFLDVHEKESAQTESAAKVNLDTAASDSPS